MAISGSASYPMPIAAYFDLASDGTLMYRVQSSTYYQLPLVSVQSLTDFDPSATGHQSNYDSNVVLLFPQARTIKAWSLSIARSNTAVSISEMQISTDTTNGEDGTWTTGGTQGQVYEYLDASNAKIRQPKLVNWAGVRGIRFPCYTDASYGSGARILYWKEIALWGEYTSAGLAFWDETVDLAVPGDIFDIGNVTQGATYSASFRIKNSHGTQTANNTTVTSPVSPIVGGIQDVLEFSDGGSYAASIVISSLAPGAMSNIITMRRVVNASETLNSFGTAKVTAVAQSWT